MRIECPICKTVIEDAPADHPPRPFCSARCKLVDLGNWFNGAYRVSESIDPLAAASEAADKQKLS
jgi:endogenous inhibitor of DNA gyrase (YacG/DUF329 family)